MDGRGRGIAPATAVALAALAVVLAGCRQDMHDQPKYQAYGRSAFFDDGRDMRPPVPGTVARGHLEDDAFFFDGIVGGQPAAALPVALTPALLDRGQERYDIYCSPCHDRVGTGEGMIVQRGYRRPASFHIDRLRQAPDGYFFDVITNGFGVMPAYRAQVPPADRWAIVAYVRALQLSQDASLADVPPAERSTLLGTARDG
jgi:mono/diheme cytochrome c family protein